MSSASLLKFSKPCHFTILTLENSVKFTEPRVRFLRGSNPVSLKLRTLIFLFSNIYQLDRNLWAPLYWLFRLKLSQFRTKLRLNLAIFLLSKLGSDKYVVYEGETSARIIPADR